LLKNSIEGSSIGVFGCGAIGLGVINTSANLGASRIVAIDINPEKEFWARKFGATDFINPSTLREGQKVQDYLVELTDGGFDFTFDCTGNVCTGYTLERNSTDTAHLKGSSYACSP
jgi:S-(hydroxymethyl)glutathione dehydrogenase/alcohol dehydrogenase